METGNPDQVVTLYREAVKAHPEDVNLYKFLAEMLGRQRKNDESIAVYSDGIKTHPESVDLRQALAEMYATGENQRSTRRVRQTHCVPSRANPIERGRRGPSVVGRHIPVA
jgi:cytochrome c-type biogenesis protein CcmH/NrfG